MVKSRFLPKVFFPVALALLISSAAASAMAGDAVLELDPAQTQINFALGGTLHTVHGTFKLKHGNVEFYPATGHASGMILVDATTGDTGNGTRDHKMHKEVLESEKYPEISFAPQRVQGQVLPQGDFKVLVSGIFTLHGASHPLTLQVQAHVAGDHLTADTTFVVPYESWGLKNPSNFLLHVNNTVEIEIHAAGRLKLPDR